MGACEPAGYGRKEAAELLLGAGAQIDALNDDELTPADAAKVCLLSLQCGAILLTKISRLDTSCVF